MLKLMLSFDLFGLQDILYPCGSALRDYIERLFKPFHYTSLRSEKSGSDDPESIVDKIIDESFKRSRISYLLEIIIGLHLDIKGESLVSLHFNEGKVIKKYNMIEKYVKKIQTSILKMHMRDEDLNVEINNDENQFL